MLTVVLPLVCAIVLYAAIKMNGDQNKSHVVNLLMGAFALRLGAALVVRELPIFSHGTGGDSEVYEMLGDFISWHWSATGIRYYTAEDIPLMGATNLPPNIFAVIIHLNGGKTMLGCTSVVALAGVLACYNVYRLATEIGAAEKQSFRVMALHLFSPQFLYYTSDTFKDGLVVFLVVTALASSFRLARKFTVAQLAVSIACALALWGVRFYMVFLTAAPVVIGVVGARSKTIARPLLIGSGFLLVVLAAGSFTGGVDTVTDSVTKTYEIAAASGTRDWNRIGGSGVEFDDGGSAFGAMHLKLLYTLFSPFPWQPGSVALQVAKLDTFAWYYLFYRAMLSARRAFEEERVLLMMFGSFLVPCTVAYAMTMSNIGLITRQRLPVIFVASILACYSWRADGSTRAQA